MSDEFNEKLLNALTAEHFAMQGAISAAVTEQQGRAAMYLHFVSGALIAIGFMARLDEVVSIALAILAMVFLSGLLTILRLVDVGMESLQAQVTVARIRRQYRTIGGAAKRLFDPAHGRWPDGRVDSGSIIGPVLGLLTTAASMIALVNGAIGACILAIGLHAFGKMSFLGITVAGLLALILQVTVFYFYQSWRIGLIISLAKDADLLVGDGRE